MRFLSETMSDFIPEGELTLSPIMERNSRCLNSSTLDIARAENGEIRCIDRRDLEVVGSFR
jgi:hypothetical protein